MNSTEESESEKSKSNNYITLVEFLTKVSDWLISGVNAGVSVNRGAQIEKGKSARDRGTQLGAWRSKVPGEGRDRES